MLTDIQAVIFDLDGTLVDSMWVWKAVDVEYLGRFGIALPKDLQPNIEGMSFHETAVYFKEHFQIPDSLEQMKAEWNRMAWKKYSCEVPLKAGAQDFLENCTKAGIRLGIATSNSRELMETIADAHGIGGYFDCILTGSEVLRGKPAPDIYLAVSEKLEVPPCRCLVFEDIIPGILAGKNAGMRVCAVADVYSEGDRAKKRELADYFIEDYRGLFSV